MRNCKICQAIEEKSAHIDLRRKDYPICKKHLRIFFPSTFKEANGKADIFGGVVAVQRRDTIRNLVPTDSRNLPAADIPKEVIDKIKELEYFVEPTFSDRRGDSELEDDCCIHIVRGGVRFCFYNGEDKGHFTERDVGRFADKVDKIIKEATKTKC